MLYYPTNRFVVRQVNHYLRSTRPIQQINRKQYLGQKNSKLRLYHQRRKYSRSGIQIVAERNYYDVLQVNEDASKEDIKRSFKKLALKLHPDVNPSPDAKQQFMEAKEAYETLSDPQLRRQYDRRLNGDFDFGVFPGGFGTKKQQDEEFYGLDEFFRDVGKELDSWMQEQQTQKQNGQQIGSIWEELSGLGEEFVEFLESELGLTAETAAEAARKVDQDIKEADESSQKAVKNVQEEADKAAQDVENMLKELKQQMGL
eukprot:TRINITY_DN36456_c0_g1_i2.p1 TRINITY_DN36456_c0_g1~~TRINITY_DN36456_c0_g1_i2.p1  ORF type:complete len:258 (-),score=42.35 TRINITY_DN36456_c0_g1_i2:214-987(-)